LVDVLAKQFVDPRERWTYRDKPQLDYILVSKPLTEAMTVAGVERRGLFQLTSSRGICGVDRFALFDR